MHMPMNKTLLIFIVALIVKLCFLCFFSSQLLLYAETMFYHMTQLAEDRDNCVGVSASINKKSKILTFLLLVLAFHCVEGRVVTYFIEWYCESYNVVCLVVHELSSNHEWPSHIIVEVIVSCCI